MRNYSLYTFSLITWVADLFGMEVGLFLGGGGGGGGLL